MSVTSRLTQARRSAANTQSHPPSFSSLLRQSFLLLGTRRTGCLKDENRMFARFRVRTDFPTATRIPDCAFSAFRCSTCFLPNKSNILAFNTKRACVCAGNTSTFGENGTKISSVKKFVSRSIADRTGKLNPTFPSRLAFDSRYGFSVFLRGKIERVAVGKLNGEIKIAACGASCRRECTTREHPYRAIGAYLRLFIRALNKYQGARVRAPWERSLKNPPALARNSISGIEPSLSRGRCESAADLCLAVRR